MGTECDVDCIDHAGASRARLAIREHDEPHVLARARALADATRIALLVGIIAQPELCACDLAWAVDRQKSLVSHHLRQLREAGLVEQHREGRFIRFTATSIGIDFARVLGADQVST